MNPMQQAMAGAIVRWLMALAGAHGIDLPMDSLEPFVNGALVLVPIAWSLLHKKNVDTAIKDAKAGV